MPPATSTFWPATARSTPTLTTNGFPDQGDYGNAFMKLSTISNQLAVADYFTMFNTVSESAADTDLGSGGALVLPDMLDGQGHSRQLAVGAGKDGNLYLVDRSNMGKFNPTNDNAIYQELDGVLCRAACGPCPLTSTARFITAPSAIISRRSHFRMPGSPTVPRKPPSRSLIPARPRAFPPTAVPMASSGPRKTLPRRSCMLMRRPTLPHEYYNSTQVAGGRDSFGNGNKFITPMIASARVYVGTTTGVGVLGLLDQSTLTPLQIWRNNYFRNPSNVGAGANGASPAGDGVPNLIKYALGLNPTNAATTAQLPTGGSPTRWRNELPDPDRSPRRPAFRHHVHCRSHRQSHGWMGFRPAEHRDPLEHGHPVGRARQHTSTGRNNPVHPFARHKSLTERSMKFSACLLRAS